MRTPKSLISEFGNFGVRPFPIDSSLGSSQRFATLSDNGREDRLLGNYKRESLSWREVASVDRKSSASHVEVEPNNSAEDFR